MTDASAIRRGLRPVRFVAAILLAGMLGGCAALLERSEARGTMDLGVVIERERGSLRIVDTTDRRVLGRVDGLGDLSHASVNFSRDGRYAYVFGRDGGLTKVDLLSGRIVRRIVQGGNSIGGAISQDGRLVAVSNYDPGGVKIFDAGSLELVADIPARGADGTLSRTVGLVDAPGNRFVWSLFEASEIWVADCSGNGPPRIRKFVDVGREPYDAFITADGRYYGAGLFGEDGLALLDLWDLDAGIRRVMPHYGRGDQKLPVFKMPHLEGWALAGDRLFVPGVGHHEVLVVDRRTWSVTGRIPVAGQPVFAVARPDSRQVWVTFAFPDNDTVQVIDTHLLSVIKTLKPGKAVLHLEFTPRGEAVWVPVRDQDKVVVFDTATLEAASELPAERPSGVFFAIRAARIGM